MQVQELLDLLPPNWIPISAILLRSNSITIGNTRTAKMVYDLRLFVSPVLGSSILDSLDPQVAGTYLAGPISGAGAVRRSEPGMPTTSRQVSFRLFVAVRVRSPLLKHWIICCRPSRAKVAMFWERTVHMRPG